MNSKIRSVTFRPLERGARKVDRKFTAMTNNAIGGLKRLKNRIGGVATGLIAAFSAREVVRGFFNMTNLASDFNEGLSYSRQLFGEYSGEMLKFAESGAVSMGMNKAEVLDGANMLAGLFRNLGIAQDRLVPLTQGALQLAADQASAKNFSSVKEALDSLSSGLLGNTENFKRFGIAIDEQGVKQKAFEMGLTNTTKGTLPQAIKIQAMYALVLEQSKDAMGDFARTNMEYANSKKVLQAQLQNLAITLGTKFLPTLNSILLKFRSMVAWIDENQSAIARVIKIGGVLIGTFFAIWGAAKVFLFISGMIKTITAVWSIMNGVIGLGKIAMVAFNVVASMNPFGWIAIAIGSIILLLSNFKVVRDFLWGMTQLFWKLHPFSWIIELTEKIFPGFKKSLVEMLGWVKGLFMKALNWISEKVIGPIKRFFSWLVGDIDFGIKGEADVKVNTTEGDSEDSIYERANKALIPDGGQPPTADAPGGSGGGKTVTGGMNSISSGKGEIKNINITINKLIESFNINSKNVQEAPANIKRMVQEALLSAVNDVNYSG
jgi:hypothetical protein